MDGSTALGSNLRVGDMHDIEPHRSVGTDLSIIAKRPYIELGQHGVSETFFVRRRLHVSCEGQ